METTNARTLSKVATIRVNGNPVVNTKQLVGDLGHHTSGNFVTLVSRLSAR